MFKLVECSRWLMKRTVDVSLGGIESVGVIRFIQGPPLPLTVKGVSSLPREYLL